MTKQSLFFRVSATSPHFLFNPVHISYNFCINGNRIFSTTIFTSIARDSDYNVYAFVFWGYYLKWACGINKKKVKDSVIKSGNRNLPPESP